MNDDVIRFGDVPLDDGPAADTASQADHLKTRLMGKKQREPFRVECRHKEARVVLICDPVLTADEIEQFSKAPKGRPAPSPVVVASKVIARTCVDIEIDGELIGFGFASQKGMEMFGATSAAGAVRVFYEPGDDDSAIVQDGNKIVDAAGWADDTDSFR